MPHIRLLGVHWISNRRIFLKNNEEHIVNLLRQQPDKALAYLYDHYASALYGVALDMVKKPAIAQEVLQDTFLKIYRSRNLYDEKKSRLFTWMLRILRNTAIDSIRKEKRVSTASLEEMVDQSQWAERPMSTDAIDLFKHVKKLAPKYSSVMELFYLQEMTHKETSDALEIPIGTVKTRIRAGLGLLKKVYERGLQIFILVNFLI